MPHDLADLAAETLRIAAAALPTVTVPAGTSWLRLMPVRYADPLGFGIGPSRFSDPRAGLVDPGLLYGVVYLASDLATAFEEAILRDRTDGYLPPCALTRGELEGWHCAILTVREPLRIVDLRASPPRRSLGIPTDAVRGFDHHGGQCASFALHEHPDRPDGIAYPSRFSGRDCLAIFDRALLRVAGGTPIPLLDFDLAPILSAFAVAVVPGSASLSPGATLL